MDEYKYPLFFQTVLFSKELLHLIDAGNKITIEDACNYIEEGHIVEFISKEFGFKNLNLSVDALHEVNSLLKNKYVSLKEAATLNIHNNGLAFIVALILTDLGALCYNMKHNEIDPEKFRLD